MACTNLKIWLKFFFHRVQCMRLFHIIKHAEHQPTHIWALQKQSQKFVSFGGIELGLPAIKGNISNLGTLLENSLLIK